MMEDAQRSARESKSHTGRAVSVTLTSVLGSVTRCRVHSEECGSLFPAP